MNVSVIIPVYNAGNFVEDAVKSAIQHPEVQQVILVEDGSPDHSLEVCVRLSQQYPKVELHRHPGGVNRGAGATRNEGLRWVRCEFVCFLDADDYFTSLRFQREREIFARHSDADGVYGATGVWIEDAVGGAAWTQSGFGITQLDTVNKEIDPKALFDFLTGVRNCDNYSGYFTINAVTFRSLRLIDSRIQFNEHLPLHEDTDFFFRLSHSAKLHTGEFEQAVAIRRVHQDNRYLFDNERRRTHRLLYAELRKWADSIPLSWRHRFTFAWYHFAARFENFPQVKRVLLILHALFCDPCFAKRALSRLLKGR
ncbi:MAG: glycosyltransferase family 2 protein [Saprospiraceae bacterium]|nr:glycosyltransferase family 2 protein [Saprospiraceae bacterium]